MCFEKLTLGYVCILKIFNFYMCCIVHIRQCCTHQAVDCN
jgi:hypothetical protein